MMPWRRPMVTAWVRSFAPSLLRIVWTRMFVVPNNIFHKERLREVRATSKKNPFKYSATFCEIQPLQLCTICMAFIMSVGTKCLRRQSWSSIERGRITFERSMFDGEQLPLMMHDWRARISIPGRSMDWWDPRSHGLTPSYRVRKHRAALPQQ